jgi:hypothetical protein
MLLMLSDRQETRNAFKILVGKNLKKKDQF